jgi:hypothetical protein
MEVSRSTALGQSGGSGVADDASVEWQRIGAAPFDRDLELAVIDYDGIHALVFPCRRILGGWMNPKTKVPVAIYPTHWREWQHAAFRTHHVQECLPSRAFPSASAAVMVCRCSI